MTSSCSRPAMPLTYSETLYSTKEDLQGAIEDVASYVSDVYASFLELTEFQREQLIKQGMWFQKDRVVLSAQDCHRFKEELKRKIIESLAQTDSKNISLETDFCAEGVLHEVAASVFDRSTEESLSLPCKTATFIRLGKKSVILLDIPFMSEETC